MPSAEAYPAYADLPRPDDGSGLPLAWGVWGAEDQLGTLNHITPETVLAARDEIQRGARFNLDIPLHLPLGETAPEAHRWRKAPTQTLIAREMGDLLVRDDKLDDFFLQASSQWDGLTHIGDTRHGFYNGVQSGQITGEAGTRNGIENMTAFGIAARGVLIDLPRHFAATGRDWHPNRQLVAAPADLDACLEAGGVTLRPGDVLLIRQGWLRGFLDAPDAGARDEWFRARTYSGLSGGEDMWEWLWERRVAAVASDTVTVEVWPPVEGRPSLHLGIARLGLVLGEMFDLEALADDCAADGRRTCFLTSSPLNLRGGVGSPPNAIAIK